MSPAAILACASGLGFGLSLIVAIGAQNVFLLRQGLRREHVLPIVAIFAASDAVLIAVGVAEIGSLVQFLPGTLMVARIAGAAFLLGYGVLAARRALSPSALDAGPAGPRMTLWAAVAACAALTWLNPHVYLDTVLLLGSVAGAHGDNRWWFGLGAAAGSILWFTALGYGARLLHPLFARPAAWRVLDALVALIMTAIAAGLLLGLAQPAP